MGTISRQSNLILANLILANLILANLILAVVGAIGGIPTVSGGAEDEVLPAEAVPEPRGTLYPDARDPDARMAYHDAIEAHVLAEDGNLHVWIRMARPLIEGIATGVDVFVDCDNDPNTGSQGFELRARACLGSRTRPNRAAPRRPGLPPAFGIRLSGHAVLMREASAAMGQWLWAGTSRVEKPRVKDDLIFFRFPLALLKENGTRYNETVRLAINVDGTIAEDPVWLEYLCLDQGLTITIDGRDDDWTGGPRARDAVGELHPVMEHLDIRDLQVDHDESSLFARVRLKTPGLEERRDGADVTVTDFLKLVAEPLGGGGYMQLQEVFIWGGHPVVQGTGYGWYVTSGIAEIRIDRPAAQTRFRVMAWTEASRRDVVGDVRTTYAFTIPSTAWKTP